MIQRLRAQTPHAARTRSRDSATSRRQKRVRASRRLRACGRARDSGTSRRVAGSSRPRRPRPAQTQAGRQAGRRTGRYSDRRAVVEADRQAARGGGADGPPAPRLLALAGEARLSLLRPRADGGRGSECSRRLSRGGGCIGFRAQTRFMTRIKAALCATSPSSTAAHESSAVCEGRRRPKQAASAAGA